MRVFGSSASDANVLKPHGEKAGSIQEVLGIYYDWSFEETLDFGKIQCAKFGPPRSHHQRIHPLSGGIRGLAITDTAVELNFGFRKRFRIIGANPGSLRHQSLRQANGG